MWGGGHVKGFNLEAASNLDVHICTHFTLFFKSLKHLSHIPQGLVVNTALTLN